MSTDEHGNKTAMLGNQNAFKGYLANKEKGFENMKKQVEKEGDQFLIMGGNAVDHSADLSDVQFNHNENISESNSDVNSEHGNKEAMKGNQNAKKLSKKDTLIEFIKKQTNIDLSKYVDDKYSKRTYLNVDWKKIPKDEQNLIRRLASTNGGQRFSLSDNGGLGMALVYGSKLQEQDKASVTDVNSALSKVTMKIKGDSEWGTSYEMENGTPLDAAMFLMSKQDGFIENAFSGITKDKRNYKIALCWGHNGLGLKHIIEKHIIEFDDFDSIPQAINVITKVLENGNWVDIQKGKIRIKNGKYVVILQKSNNGTFIISDYDNSRSPLEKERSEIEKNRKRQEVFGKSRTSSLDLESHLSLNNASNDDYTTSLENVNGEHGNKGNWLLTGYDLFDEKEKATDVIDEVISRYGYTPEFSVLKTQVGAVIASLDVITVHRAPIAQGDNNI